MDLYRVESVVDSIVNKETSKSWYGESPDFCWRNLFKNAEYTMRAVSCKEKRICGINSTAGRTQFPLTVRLARMKMTSLVGWLGRLNCQSNYAGKLLLVVGSS